MFKYLETEEADDFRAHCLKLLLAIDDFNNQCCENPYSYTRYHKGFIIKKFTAKLRNHLVGLIL